jgi:pyridoxamine 5'-phosphate oxidase
MNVADVRREFTREGLRRRDLDPDPVAQFLKWMEQAREAHPGDFTSMVLATADREGRPSARVVLLKGCDERGFLFFSHYTGRKGRELSENPRAALVFYWPALDRQVRVEGTVERSAPEDSDAYFQSRPLGSRLSAFVSHQSEPVAGREELERAVEEALERFGEAVPRPDSWGGFLVVPEEIELWQGRESRLHDRFRYRRHAEDGWTIDRLSP